MLKNVPYKGPEIAQFYGTHRRRWEEFYPSEQWAFERVAACRETLGDVLDVGCAVGGLGEALMSRFPIESYTGVDISTPAIAGAKARAWPGEVPVEFHAADICDCPQIGDRRYDLVTGLSVVDWNSDPGGILKACWDRVAPGGFLLLSLRLTDQASVSDKTKSWQYVWFDQQTPPAADTEIAQYTVLNAGEALAMLAAQMPAPTEITAYGYWGKPSAFARTPFERILFSLMVARRPGEGGAPSETRVEAHWPLSAFTKLF